MLEALQTLLDNGISKQAILPIIEGMFEDGAEDVKRLALLYHCADGNCNIEASKYNDCVFTVAGKEYLVLDKDERESHWDDALELLLDELVEGPYFDREAWKRDARFDGAGHTLAGYDGAEEEVDTSGAGAGWYYIYRIG